MYGGCGVAQAIPYPYMAWGSFWMKVRTAAVVRIKMVGHYAVVQFCVWGTRMQWNQCIPADESVWAQADLTVLVCGLPPIKDTHACACLQGR